MDDENAQLSSLEAVVVASPKSPESTDVSMASEPKTYTQPEHHTTKGVTGSKSTKPWNEMWRNPSPQSVSSLPLLLRMSVHPCSVCLHYWRTTHFASKYPCTSPPPPLRRRSLGEPHPPPPRRPSRAMGGGFQMGGGSVHSAAAHGSVCHRENLHFVLLHEKGPADL